jgi:hypothetical protein
LHDKFIALAGEDGIQGYLVENSNKNKIPQLNLGQLPEAPPSQRAVDCKKLMDEVNDEILKTHGILANEHGVPAVEEAGNSLHEADPRLAPGDPDYGLARPSGRPQRDWGEGIRD